ncbi:glycosyltransferase family 4 protein [Hahella sp. CR1]|uniref:glycosyltransferase family 4 protein n=1 Tax=Hahella sp. CR1 TaxID=2992807 RepID=UPI002442CD66|nr:glycosyltransferase family 4 protein [Hahella sp. CR1]MDG9669834.1 glycosyltransferase family 4 protein [Hahella sp. CR1]
MTIKLAIIRQKYRPDGGAERFISRALDALGAQNLELTVLTRKWEGQASNVKVITCNPPKWGRISRERRFANAVCAQVAGHDFDLVQSHERMPCCDIYRAGDGVHRSWLEQRKRILSKVKQRWLELSPYHRYVLESEKRLFASSRLRAVICNSHMVKEEIIRYFNFPEANIHVIYNGVNAEQFSPQACAPHRAKIRQQLGIPTEATALIFVGSGFERKGLATAITALAQTSPQAHLIVVGGDKHERAYRSQANKLSLNGRVHFAGVKKEVIPYYAAADALILPALYDPFPNVIFEAMACALPVITSKQCGGAELIKQGESGYVVDALDSDGCASAILKLLDQPHRLSLGAAARNAIEPYSPERMGQQLTDLYKRLLPVNGSME